MNDKLSKLKSILGILDQSLTKEEFYKHIDALIEVVKEIRAKNEKEIENLRELYSQANRELETENESRFEKFKNGIYTEHEKMMSLIIQKLNSIKDGKDADEEMILEKLKNFIPEPPKIDDIKKGLEDFGTQIQTAYEIIDELKKEVEEVKSRPVRVGGGFSKMAMESKFIDDETPSGTPNGILTTFTIVSTPNPTSSLKVYLDGQRMKLTTDYTFSGRTITFLTAPLTGSIITVDYRV